MTIDSGSQRYGRAVHHAMAELLDGFPESAQPHALEVANSGSRWESRSGSSMGARLSSCSG